MTTVVAKGRTFTFSVENIDQPSLPPETDKELGDFIESCQGDVQISAQKRNKNAFEIRCVAVDLIESSADGEPHTT